MRRESDLPRPPKLFLPTISPLENWKLNLAIIIIIVQKIIRSQICIDSFVAHLILPRYILEFSKKASYVIKTSSARVQQDTMPGHGGHHQQSYVQVRDMDLNLSSHNLDARQVNHDLVHGHESTVWHHTMVKISIIKLL